MLFVSDFVLAEIRDIPNKPIPRKAGVTPQKAELLIALLMECAEVDRRATGHLCSSDRPG